MRTYNILREKVRRFNSDPEIQGLLQEVRAANHSEWLGAYSKEKGRALREEPFDPERQGGIAS